MLTQAVVLSALAAMGLALHVTTNTAIDTRPATDSLTETMQAMAYQDHGGIDVLQLQTDYPKPVPRDNQVLVKVKASALNPVDFKLRRNPVPSFLIPKPKIVGFDVAGEIVQVGKDVKNFQVGDRVAAMMPLLGSKWGALAEYAAVDESFLGKLGDDSSIDYPSAASLPLAALTAMQNLKKLDNPQGKKILIQAGAGGVGTLAIQYAKKALGMYVACTASAAKADFLKDHLGADLVVDYRAQNFEDVIQDYDAVLDSMSFLYEARTLGAGSKVLKSDGHYLNILSSDWSFHDGKEDAIGLLSATNYLKSMVGRLFFGAKVLPKYDLTYVRPNGKDLQEVLDLVRDGTIRPVVDKIYPLAEAKEAMKYLETGRATGKVVLSHE